MSCDKGGRAALAASTINWAAIVTTVDVETQVVRLGGLCDIEESQPERA